MNIRVVSVNDTQHYNLRPEDRADIVSIHTVYAYTPEVHVHLCELTPSYELRYLYTYLTAADHVDSWRADELDSVYCYEPNEDTYMHCGSALFRTAKDCGEFEDLQSAAEYLCCNCPV